jgi:hypothetical protein
VVLSGDLLEAPHMQKPIVREDLVATVERWVGMSRQRRPGTG